MNKANKTGTLSPSLLLIFSAVILEGLYLFYALADSADDLKYNNYLYIIINAIAFFVFTWLAVLTIRGTFNALDEKHFLRIIIISAVIFRSTLLFTHIATSDDWYRYGWEGIVLLNGHNPYAVTPADSVTRHLFTDAFSARVILKHMPTMYPPLAHIVFVTAAYFSGENITGIKIIFLLCELFTLILLLRLLRLKRIPIPYILLYAWMPLIVMEFFINVHIDAAALPFLLLFVMYAEEERPYPALLAFTAMLLLKTYALFVLPLLLRKIPFKKLLLPGVLSCSLILGAYLPFLNNHHSVTESLMTYLRHWEFNGSTYNIFKLIFSDHVQARMVCGVLFTLSAIVVYVRYRDFTRGAAGIYMLFIIFATTVYPWYLSWLMVLTPAAGFVSPIVLSGIVNLSNFTPLGSVWREYQWVWITEYSVFFLFIIYDFRLIFRKAIWKKQLEE